MNAKQQKAFLNAMKEMVEEKGISESVIVDAISDAFKVAYNKKLSDELLIVKKPSKLKIVKRIKDKDGNVVQTETTKLSDALIRCDIDLKKGKIETYRQWKIVNDDDLTDDFVEISVNDDKVKAQNLKVGDFYEEPLSFDDFSKGDVNRFISAYKAKINKAEKDSLLKSFSGKIHELINGTVEKSDGRSVLVNIGKISITLYNKDLIGHETFKPGDNIRMYVCGIANDESKGESLIKCSRSVPEFIGKIFTDEVHEVYDGTVKIYKIARMAGIRSKVAVYSEDPNVDAQGACIGPNGTRVQNIVNSLGNGKEKIDVVQYYPVLGMFLRECLKPGVVIGVKFEDLPDGKKKAIAVCENDTGRLAIGTKGTNVILARELCGLEELVVYDQSVAEEKNIDFEPMATFEEQNHEFEKEKFRISSMKNAQLASKQILDEVKPVVSDDEYLDKKIDLDEEEAEAKPVNDADVSVKNEPESTNDLKENHEEEPEVKEEVEEEKPVVNETKPLEENTSTEENKEPEVKEEVKAKPVEPQEFKEVKTTTTLDALEASLEEEKRNEKQHVSKAKKNKKNHKDKNENDENKLLINDSNKMSIYTDEELADMENEDEDLDDDNLDDEDYSEYDSDDYYDK